VSRQLVDESAVRTRVAASPRPASSVSASIAQPDASASSHPNAPHEHKLPLGTTLRCPMWPALPDSPSSSLTVDHEAPTDAGRDHH